jgi:DNA-binding CsgD family transcriptional regulator
LLILVSCEVSSPGVPSSSYDVSGIVAQSAGISRDSIPVFLGQFPPDIRDSFFIRLFRQLEIKSTKEDIFDALELYRTVLPESPWLRGLEDYYNGISHQYAGKFDSADLCYALAEKVFESIHAKYHQALVLDSHAGSLLTQGRPDEAVPLKIKAISLLDDSKHVEKKMKVQLHLANIFSLKGDCSMANKWMEEPTRFYEMNPDTMRLAYINTLKASCLAGQNDFQQSLLHHRKALAQRLSKHDTITMTESFFHIGRLLGKMGRWQESLDTLRIAEKLMLQSEDKQGASHIASSIGDALFNLNRYGEAEHYLLSSYNQSLQRKQYPAASIAVNRLSAVRKYQKNYEEALQFYEKYTSLKDTIFNQEKQKLSMKLEAEFDSKRKEEKIHAMQREQKMIFQRNSMIAALLVFFAGWLFLQFRRRMIAEKNKALESKVAAEALAQYLEEKLTFQKIELEKHQKDLKEYALKLMEKNRQEMPPEAEDEQKVAGQDESNTSNWDEMYHQAILTKSDWERFLFLFSQAHPGYISKLRQSLPDISPAELRIILLGKLGLSLSETSNILGISLDAVKKGRYRLKKKYNLDSDDLSNIIPYP